MRGRARYCRFDADRGAALVPVAMALFISTLLTAVIVDYGLQLVSRNQMQNAADAAALAGATALAFDSYTDRSTTGPAYTVVQSVAKTNLVQGSDSVATEIEFRNCDTLDETGPGVPPPAGCVKVTAYRDDGHGNPITALFGSLLGASSYNVRATAMAEAKRGNATDCLKPLAIPDRWNERYPAPATPWSETSSFDIFKVNPPPPVLLDVAEKDLYARPDVVSPRWGLRLSEHIARDPVILRLGSLGTPVAPISAWRYLPLDLGNGKSLHDNTTACAGSDVALDAEIDVASGDLTTNALEIADGLNELVADPIVGDPDAHWNPDMRRVEGGCAETPECSMSRRIIAVALYDPQALADASITGLPTTVVIRNIVGFFVESVSGTEVTGYITMHPGRRVAGTRLLIDDSSFLRTTVLVE